MCSHASCRRIPAQAQQGQQPCRTLRKTSHAPRPGRPPSLPAPACSCRSHCPGWPPGRARWQGWRPTPPGMYTEGGSSFRLPDALSAWSAPPTAKRDGTLGITCLRAAAGPVSLPPRTSEMVMERGRLPLRRVARRLLSTNSASAYTKGCRPWGGGSTGVVPGPARGAMAGEVLHSRGALIARPGSPPAVSPHLRCKVLKLSGHGERLGVRLEADLLAGGRRQRAVRRRGQHQRGAVLQARRVGIALKHPGRVGEHILLLGARGLGTGPRARGVQQPQAGALARGSGGLGRRRRGGGGGSTQGRAQAAPRLPAPPTLPRSSGPKCCSAAARREASVAGSGAQQSPAPLPGSTRRTPLPMGVHGGRSGRELGASAFGWHRVCV